MAYTNGPAAANVDPELPQEIQRDMVEIGAQVTNIVATGGYLALMEYTKDNPELQKKVTRVAVALGALDALVDVSNNGVTLDFELNPLLITSFAYFIGQMASTSKNIKIQKLSLAFNKTLATSMKVIEFAGYSALALEALDWISDGALSDVFIELLSNFEALDGLGNLLDAASGVADAADFASLGLSFLASRAIKYVFKELNKDTVLEIKSLTDKTAPKKILVNMLESDAPATLLLGPYCSVMGKEM